MQKWSGRRAVAVWRNGGTGLTHRQQRVVLEGVAIRVSGRARNPLTVAGPDNSAEKLGLEENPILGEVGCVGSETVKRYPMIPISRTPQ